MHDRSPLPALVLIALAAGCTPGTAPGAPTGALDSPTSTRNAQPTRQVESPAPRSTPAPVCPDRRPGWVGEAARVDHGAQDPAGRIVFGQESRFDDVLGQVVGPLFAIDPDGSDLEQILSCDVERPRFSPDGSRLAFSIAMDDGTWQVATSKPDGTDIRILTNTKGLAETPDWGPDGSWIIYALGDEPCDPWPDCIETGVWQYNLWRMNADGTDQRLVGDPEKIDWEPRVSPDGREIVFSRFVLEDNLDPVLMIRNLETGEERLATTDNEVPEHPDWSRDGRSIVYNTYWEAGGLQQVKVAPADDANATPVVLYGEAGKDGFKPAYSPDGSRIVFACGQFMCLMNADGSDVIQLVAAPGAYLNHFDWGAPTP